MTGKTENYNTAEIRFIFNIILTNFVCFSDPYVRVDLNTLNNNETIDSVLTKTKKRVSNNKPGYN